MREKLIEYVNYLFAGTPDSEDIKQEILQNTLDRFDDLVSQGKTPEAAYSLAISGIGDVSEILGNTTSDAITHKQSNTTNSYSHNEGVKSVWRKCVYAVAIALYIICIIPLIVLSEIGMELIGLCATLVIVAVATALIIIASSGKRKEKEEQIPESAFMKAYKSVSGAVTLCIYLAVSFATGAWWITWLIFPISGAVDGIVKATVELKEAKNHEN